MDYPRLLILGTIPYDRNTSSRAFDAYFHGWPKEKIAQIFSHPYIPSRGHCGTLYQITDVMMLHRWMNKKVATGHIYNYDELEEEIPKVEKTAVQHQSSLVATLYKYGKKHTPFTHLLRKVLWRKSYWNTSQLNEWLDDFRPECIFLSFSNDFFLLEIALYVARKYNISICSSTGDDYYFNTHFSLNPFWYIYHGLYRRLNREVFRHPGSAIYISDKIRDKYNEAFGLNGETVYLISEIKRREFRPINTKSIKVSYFGNIGMGRNQSLADIGTALGKINPNYKLQVFSDPNPQLTSVFDRNANVEFCGKIPYTEVMKRSLDSDILVIVEGFAHKDVITTRYSLSTKVADSLASGCNILVYGSPECGAMEYMQHTGCATVCYSIDEIVEKLKKLIFDVELQRSNYERAAVVSAQNHTLEQSTATLKRIVCGLVENNK